MTQASGIHFECDISCATPFHRFTSISNPQDVAVSVSGQIHTMPCLFKTCKQMLGNTQLLSCCIMFHINQGKNTTHHFTHAYIGIQTHTHNKHTLPNMDMRCHTHPESHSRLLVYTILLYSNCGLANQP